MAHKGKIYPVLFRRDFNLNIFDNDIGWARRYLAKTTFNATGKGRLLSDFVFDCGPDTYPVVNHIEWESDWYDIGLHTYRLTVTVQLVHGSQYIRTLRYDEDVNGTVLDLQFAGEFPEDHPNFRPGELLSINYWDPTFFDRQPSFVQGFVPEKRWGDGEPH